MIFVTFSSFGESVSVIEEKKSLLLIFFQTYIKQYLTYDQILFIYMNKPLNSQKN